MSRNPLEDPSPQERVEVLQFSEQALNDLREIMSGLNPRGAWDVGTPYSRMDVVSYSGSSYIAINASTGSQPDVITDDWVLLSQIGTTGDQGDPGPAGTLEDVTGDFFAVTIGPPGVVFAAGSPCNVAGELRAFKFVLPFKTTVSKVSFVADNAGSVGALAFGFYDVNKDLVYSTGGITADVNDESSGHVHDFTLTTPMTLESGTYYLVQTANQDFLDNFNQVSSVDLNTPGLQTLTKFSKYATKAQNLATLGAGDSITLPATLGVLTVQAYLPMVLYFYT